MIEGDRPQDVGRVHAKGRPTPTPATAALLDSYRDAMRGELADTLAELRPDREQLTLDGGAERMRPALAERLKLWDLAIKLGRELANGDDPGAWTPGPPEPPARPKGPPRLTKAQRASVT